MVMINSSPLGIPMILFDTDWKHYPRAIVDTKTKNESFLAMAYRYKEMGIKNYYFMLALHNPTLQGVDPFDPKLTDEQKLDIAIECRSNIWYFLREVARLPPVAGVEPIPFKANRGNIALIWLFLNHITAILIQPRQTGKSGSVDTLTVWLIDVATNHTKMLMITKDSELQVDAISRLKGIRELLPKYIYDKNRGDTDNKTGLNNSVLENEYKTGVARSNVQAANNLGRGMTLPIVHFDEVPFITHIAVTMPAALKAGGAARRMAEKNKAMWGTIMTTTAGRRDDRDGSYVYNEIISKAMIWNEVLFDCRSRLEAVKMVDRGCTGRGLKVVDITMSHRQLGYDDKWLYNSIRESGGTREDNERDYLNIWNSGSARSPLTAELTEKIRNSVVDPVWSETTEDSFVVRWYVSPDKLQQMKSSTRFIMGLDSSEAVGRDAIAMVILDVSTLAVVGAATVNLANIVEFAHWLAQFMMKHVEITLIPERKSTGQTIIDMLLVLLPQHGVDPFKRIYNSIVEEAKQSKEGEEAYNEICGSLSHRDSFFYTERKAKFGYVTNAARRDFLYGNVLQQAAKQTANLVHDKKLSNEILGLSVRNNRIDHSTSGHDDHVFSWLMAHWFTNFAMNLHHYGIEPGVALSGVNTETLDDRPISVRWKEERQREYREEIEILVETLSNCENEALISLYERKLQMLSRKIEATGVDKNFSVDAVLEKVRRERQNRLRLSQSLGSLDPDEERRNQVIDTIASYQRNMYRPTSVRW